MDRAQEALERARQSEETLRALRQELAGIETGAGSLHGAPPPPHAWAAAAEDEPLSILGTSIDDLARLHEGHADNMRAFGRAYAEPAQPQPAYTSNYSARAAPLPTPSAEPTAGRRQYAHGTAAVYAERDVQTATGAASHAAMAEARLTGSAPSLSGLTSRSTRPAFDRPLACSTDQPAAPLSSAPMQRPTYEIKEHAAQASARASAATEARYAAQAAQARARVEAAAAKQAARSAYLLERDGAATERALAALGDAALASQARASLPTRPQSARPATAGPAGSAAFGDGGGSSGGGAPPASVAPRTAIRYPAQTTRPTSAPKDRPRVTVPVPFSFAHRPKKETLAERKLAEELEEKARAFEKAAKENTRARDLPPSTAPGLYSEMVAEAEQASRERRQIRRTVPVPFSFQERRESRGGAKAASNIAGEWQGIDDSGSAGGLASSAAGTGEGLWYENGEMVGGRKSFKARDVPRSMSEPRWEIMRVQEAERRERVAQRALESAAKSKLPPRMQEHKETQQAKKAAEAARIQQELDSELTLRPKITNEVPDFDRLHLNFEKSLARKRHQFHGTTPAPFRMESEPYRMMQREVKQVRDEMIQRDIRRDELVMPERRWPYLSTQAPIGRKSIPDFKKEHDTWQSKVSTGNTTEKLEAHKAKLAEQARQEAKKSAMERKAEEERQRAQKDITLKVANRLKEVAGDTRNIKKAAREEAARRKEEHRQAWVDRKKALKEQMDAMNSRLEARPFLFEQASIDVAVERAKAEAHDKFDATLRKHGVGTSAGLADRLDP